jgi:hypothetical protein
MVSYSLRVEYTMAYWKTTKIPYVDQILPLETHLIAHYEQAKSLLMKVMAVDLSSLK